MEYPYIPEFGLTGRAWLEHHLETFVKPRVTIPDPNKLNPYWCNSQLEALNLIWSEAKKRSKGKTILLAGRDVWEFEVLARIEGISTSFRGDISTSTCALIAKTEDFSKFYLLDTGYKGTVPKSLNMTHWDLISYRGATHTQRLEHQVFFSQPDTIEYMSSKLEGTPKYWCRAELLTGMSISRWIPSITENFSVTAASVMKIAEYALFRRRKRGTMSLGRGV